MPLVLGALWLKGDYDLREEHISTLNLRHELASAQAAQRLSRNIELQALQDSGLDLAAQDWVGRNINSAGLAMQTSVTDLITNAGARVMRIDPVTPDDVTLRLKIKASGDLQSLQLLIYAIEQNTIRLAIESLSLLPQRDGKTLQLDAIIIGRYAAQI